MLQNTIIKWKFCAPYTQALSVFNFIGVISECKGLKISNQKDGDEMSTKKYIQNLF